MRGAPSATSWERLGLSPRTARELATRSIEGLRRRRGGVDAEAQVRLWLEWRGFLLGNPETRRNFAAHLGLYRLAYEGRPQEAGPGPAWVPSADDVRESNIGRMMSDHGFREYDAFHRWSVENREDFWLSMVRRLGIAFRTPPTKILDAAPNPAHPDWMPGASLNIAESCFEAKPDAVAIVSKTETSPEVQRTTYAQLRNLCNRVANGLRSIGMDRGGRIALYMPMTSESVAVYLGAILAGCCVVGIADTSAPQDLAKRVRIGGATVVFTVDSYVRDGKEQRIYDKVIAAGAPRAVVVPQHPESGARTERPDDLAWDEFLGDHGTFDAVPCRPSDFTSILFSSGTTKDPKAIPWTHTTPIKSASDAFLHHDVRPSDVLLWSTSFGWMMGPWLTYASLVNGAAMGLYVGAPQRRDFGEFVQDAGVTILGVVPKLVRTWKAGGTMEGLDWSRIRLFTSTAEPSTPDEMLYLMFLAGFRPIIEYCGGTEIGGGYITGTVVQPCAPSTFTTPALGLDFIVLDGGRPARRGEVFLVPPSIGLSNELLNYDHEQEYFGGLPPGPHGERLRRHGDQVEVLGGGYYRHHGRIDDMINIQGVKTSSEEVRSVIAHDLVYDAKPVAVDVDGTGQHRLVIYAVPRDKGRLGSNELRARLREDFERAIKARLSPLLAHVHDVVLVPELPQAGPGKTVTMKELRRDYLARSASS